LRHGPALGLKEVLGVFLFVAEGATKDAGSVSQWMEFSVSKMEFIK